MDDNTFLVQMPCTTCHLVLVEHRLTVMFTGQLWAHLMLLSLVLTLEGWLLCGLKLKDVLTEKNFTEILKTQYPFTN